MQIGSVNFTPVAVDVSYADSVALDSFGRLRVSSPTTLFDALAARQDSISIVCTSFTGTSSITSSINWFEQTV